MAARHFVARLWHRLAGRPRRIIDVHAHDVPLSRKFRAFCEGIGSDKPWLLAWLRHVETARVPDLLADMDVAGVDRVLVVLSSEVDEFTRLADRHPGRLLGLAYFDSLRPREGLTAVRALVEGRPDRILGVKTALPYFGQDPRRDELAPLYEYCAARGLPLQFHMGGDPAMEAACRPEAFAEVASEYPTLPIVCLHGGGGWHREMPALLRARDNISLQVEALQLHEAEGDGRPRVLRDLLRRADSRRMMFGSDWMGREAKYFARVRTIRRIPRRYRQDLCWRTAARVYGPHLLGEA